MSQYHSLFLFHSSTYISCCLFLFYSLFNAQHYFFFIHSFFYPHQLISLPVPLPLPLFYMSIIPSSLSSSSHSPVHINHSILLFHSLFYRHPASSLSFLLSPLLNPPNHKSDQNTLPVG